MDKHRTCSWVLSTKINKRCSRVLNLVRESEALFPYFCVCGRLRVHIGVYVHKHVYLFVCAPVCACIDILNMHIFIHKNIRICIYIYVNIKIYPLICTCIFLHLHVHILAEFSQKYIKPMCSVCIMYDVPHKTHPSTGRKYGGLIAQNKSF